MIVVLVSVFLASSSISVCSNDLDELVIKESFEFSIAFWAFSAAADGGGGSIESGIIADFGFVASSSALNSRSFFLMPPPRDRYGLGVLVIFPNGSALCVALNPVVGCLLCWRDIALYNPFALVETK